MIPVFWILCNDAVLFFCNIFSCLVSYFSNVLIHLFLKNIQSDQNHFKIIYRIEYKLIFFLKVTRIITLLSVLSNLYLQSTYIFLNLQKSEFLLFSKLFVDVITQPILHFETINSSAINTQLKYYTWSNLPLSYSLFIRAVLLVVHVVISSIDFSLILSSFLFLIILLFTSVSKHLTICGIGSRCAGKR